MNTDLNMTPKLVVFAILILGMILSGCKSEIHTPVDQAREVVTTMNRMDVNRFDVKKFEVLDDQNIKVTMVARNTSMICVVTRNPIDSADGVNVVYTSHLGRMVEQQGKTAFFLSVVNHPNANIKCDSTTGDFPPHVLDYIDFYPITELRTL